MPRKGTKLQKKRKCQVGYPCKMTCISIKKNCRAPLRWQAETFAKWLKSQEERFAVTNQKRAKAGLSPATMNDMGYISAQRIKVTPKTAIAKSSLPNTEKPIISPEDQSIYNDLMEKRYWIMVKAKNLVDDVRLSRFTEREYRNNDWKRIVKWARLEKRNYDEVQQQIDELKARFPGIVTPKQDQYDQFTKRYGDNQWEQLHKAGVLSKAYLNGQYAKSSLSKSQIPVNSPVKDGQAIAASPSSVENGTVINLGKKGKDGFSPAIVSIRDGYVGGQTQQRKGYLIGDYFISNKLKYGTYYEVQHLPTGSILANGEQLRSLTGKANLASAKQIAKKLFDANLTFARKDDKEAFKQSVLDALDVLYDRKPDSSSKARTSQAIATPSKSPSNTETRSQSKLKIDPGVAPLSPETKPVAEVQPKPKNSDNGSESAIKTEELSSSVITQKEIDSIKSLVNLANSLAQSTSDKKLAGNLRVNGGLWDRIRKLAKKDNTIVVRNSRGEIESAAQIVNNTTTIYIAFLVTNPKNIAGGVDAVKGAGTAALVALAQKAHREGKSLHLNALPTAALFYRKIGMKQYNGMHFKVEKKDMLKFIENNTLLDARTGQAKLLARKTSESAHDNPKLTASFLNNDNDVQAINSIIESARLMANKNDEYRALYDVWQDIGQHINTVDNLAALISEDTFLTLDKDTQDQLRAAQRDARRKAYEQTIIVRSSQGIESVAIVDNSDDDLISVEYVATNPKNKTSDKKNAVRGSGTAAIVAIAKQAHSEGKGFRLTALSSAAPFYRKLGMSESASYNFIVEKDDVLTFIHKNTR